MRVAERQFPLTLTVIKELSAMSIYFTYHLYHTPTDKNYYGVRYANGCNPSDLWTTYFSSSEIVHQLIEEYGIDSFVATVRKTFDSKESAIEYEMRFLKKINAAANNKWINRQNGDKNFRGAQVITEKTRIKMSKSRKGKTHSEETKRKMCESRRKRPPISEETRQKMCAASKGRGLGRTMSEETRKKIGDAAKGRVRGPMSEEQKRKISESLRKTGYKHSEEVKQRISNSKKGRPRKSVT